MLFLLGYNLTVFSEQNLLLVFGEGKREGGGRGGELKKLWRGSLLGGQLF